MRQIRRRHYGALAAVGVLACLVRAAAAQDPPRHAVADVVVIVDTSTSMSRPGMDRERASLLVTKLLADIVPGDLAVVRLLDVDDDQNVIPSHVTGKTAPCQEDPSRTCHEVEPAIDWEAAARSGKLGALRRPARADAGYKQALGDHLAQRVNNSMFYLAFRAAQGVFDDHRQNAQFAEIPRTVIWLSDGRSDGPGLVERAVRELSADHVAVEALVFGQGDTQLASASGLSPRRVSTPAEIMKAFAGAFRRIVQAPYEIDNLVSVEPSFTMNRAVDEAWVVVYGDASLGDVTLEGPGGTVKADYAADRWDIAGAYRVAYMEHPTAGKWTVHATGGGVGVAYAVVQRSALAPVLLEPKNALSGVSVRLVAGIRAGGQTLITDPELLRDVTVTAEVQGQTLTLNDRGTAPDATAGDGRFSASVTFQGAGKVPVRIRIRSPLVDRTIQATVDVSGTFRYTGGPLDLDLGTLGVAAESCRQLQFEADFRGAVPFALKQLRTLPAGHVLEVRGPAGKLLPGGPPRVVSRGQRFDVCLTTSERAPSSAANGELWLELHVAGTDAREQTLPIRLHWQVHGLTFWQRWGWLILLILGILLLLFIILGYVLPQRFQGALAVVFVPDRDELDEQLPQPVKQWRGVGIGFYRNARAFLHPDYRLSGNPQGALASLEAERGGARVLPGKGLTLFRETLDADWEGVPAPGRRARGGDVYRIGERGPFFRIATRGGV